MGTGTRHLLGAITGVVAIPVVAAVTVGGLGYIQNAYNTYLTRPASLYLAAGLIVVAGVLVALLVGTRISPLASLLPGVAYIALGAVGVVLPETIAKALRAVLPMTLHITSSGMTVPFGQAAVETVWGGGFLLLGVILLVASIAPSRWRAKPRAVAPGTHRMDAGPGPDEPWPPQPPSPSDPANHRATPPLPGDAAAHGYPPPEYPYGPSSGPQPPYAPNSGPQAPYGEAPGYRSGDRPSSWSGPQAPYGQGAEPHHFGDDPYPAPAEPWGPAPGSAQADPTPRTLPDASAGDDGTRRIPWFDADRDRPGDDR
ncbi:MAG TPA: hypothetical protein VGL93_05910 [Streptosporangiaceae bacterium]|jgi:hypothetical protein